MSRSPPDLAEIQAAAGRLKPWIRTTPLLPVEALSAEKQASLWVKAESLQGTGSFKLRGALNAVALLPEAERARGVIAFSSGNHAQGVAAAAGIFGVPATIVMPLDAPAIKRRNTEALGARVIAYDRFTEDRSAIAAALQAETGAPVIPPFDHPDIIAGQGTVGLELAEACRERGLEPDAVLVPISGGGLMSGIAVAIQAAFPACAVIGCEPAACNDLGLSLAAGERRAHGSTTAQLCDALQSPIPGVLPWAILSRRSGIGAVAVADAAVLRGMALAMDQLKLVLEPGGAIGLGAILDGLLPVEGRTILVVASGGNVDPEILRRALV